MYIITHPLGWVNHFSCRYRWEFQLLHLLKIVSEEDSGGFPAGVALKVLKGHMLQEINRCRHGPGLVSSGDGGWGSGFNKIFNLLLNT